VKRKVEPELLDDLPPEDARARASRADLRRLNAWMGNTRLAAHALAKAVGSRAPFRIVQLGAGDGSFLLSVARQLATQWSGVRAVLVDRRKAAGDEILSAFATINWRAHFEEADVFDWLGRSAPQTDDVLIANLFLHHFPHEQLRELCRQSAAAARSFIAVEPRRSHWALFCSRCLALAGCHAVTCHDAPVSVRAGFAQRELSRIWPQHESWSLEERAAGLFSHLFVARRLNQIPNFQLVADSGLRASSSLP